jgi:hypothetical protein
VNILLLVTGIIITIWAFIESLWTTIWVDGNSAPITSRLTTFIWRTMRSFISRKNHRLLSLSGPLILFLTIVLWISFIWLGWTIIFYSDTNSIIAKDNSSIKFVDTLWYVAYLMFTIGNGDYSPSAGIWKFLSSIVGMGGMLMITLSVTYILQIISAVVNKRSLASQITSIGKTAEDFVMEQWNGEGFGAIELQMQSITSQIATITGQHLAYPILNYYHSAKFENSLPVATAIYDDALTLIAAGVKKEYHPPTTILTSGRQTINNFLHTLQAAFIKAADDNPPPPDLNKLKEANIPTVSEEEFQQKLKGLQERRKLISGMIKNDAWHWPK